MTNKELNAKVEETLRPQDMTPVPDESLSLSRFLKFIEPKKDGTNEIYEHTLNRFTLRITVGRSVTAGTKVVKPVVESAVLQA